jgi:hypothetical protein
MWINILIFLYLAGFLAASAEDRNDFYREVASNRTSAATVLALLESKYPQLYEDSIVLASVTLATDLLSRESLIESNIPGFSFHDYFHGNPLPEWTQNPAIDYELYELFHHLCPGDIQAEMERFYNRSTTRMTDPLCQLAAYSHFNDSLDLLAVTNVYRASAALDTPSILTIISNAFWAGSSEQEVDDIDGAMILHSAIGLLRTVFPVDGRDLIQSDLDNIKSLAEIMLVRRDGEESISIFFNAPAKDLV